MKNYYVVAVPSQYDDYYFGAERTEEGVRDTKRFVLTSVLADAAKLEKERAELLIEQFNSTIGANYLRLIEVEEFVTIREVKKAKK